MTKLQETNGTPETPIPLWIVTITLGNGEKRSHRYQLPLTIEEAAPIIDSISRRILEAMAGLQPGFALDGPKVLYNPRHVASIQFDGSNSAAIEAYIQRQELGFLSAIRQQRSD